MGRGKAAVDRQRVAVYIGCSVAEQETRRFANFAWMAITFRWIDLTYLIFFAALSSEVKGGLSHTGFNKSWTDGVDPDASAVELICDSLNDADDAGFAR